MPSYSNLFRDEWSETAVLAAERIKNASLKAIRKLQRDGFGSTVVAIMRHALQAISPSIGLYNVLHRREMLSKKFMEQFNGRVQYGPLAGFKLEQDSWWCGNEKRPMLFGLYEQEILASLSSIPKNYTHFIDFGAADGYYGVGVVAAGMFKRSTCFEISPIGRKVIRESAKTNGVEQSVRILGKAEQDFYEEIEPALLNRSVLFLDVEGAEFDLLDSTALSIFKNSIIIVELHPWLVPDGEAKLERLKETVSSTHRISEITMGSRDPTKYAELAVLADDDRCLICSEGRGRLMSWWRLDPL